jgi:hypothetical protein
MAMMKRDGIDKEIGDYRYPDYLVPFKQLVQEKNRTIKTIKNKKQNGTKH